MKRTIEINDTLAENVQDAISKTRDLLLSYLEENKPDDLPCPSNDLNYFGGVDEIVDGCVPIYTTEIEDTFYLHGSEIEQAFDDAGIGEKKDEAFPCGWKAAAIYCYIEQEVNAWYNSDAQDIFDHWAESQETDADG